MKSRTNEVKWSRILVLPLFIFDLFFEEQEKDTSPVWSYDCWIEEGAFDAFVLGNSDQRELLNLT